MSQCIVKFDGEKICNAVLIKDLEDYMVIQVDSR